MRRLAMRYLLSRRAPTAFRKSLNPVCRGMSAVSLSKPDSSGISILAMKNDPMNTLSLDFMKEMIEAIKDAEDNKQCRAIVLTSTCRLFSAGLDLNILHNPKKEKLKEYWSTYQDLSYNLYGTRLATVASIDGHALGAGCTLALCCDSRSILISAKLGLNEAEYGLCAPPWVMQMYKNLIGNHKAERACSIGQIFDAELARMFDLVDVVARQENFSAEAYKLALKWANVPGREINKILFRGQVLEKLKYPYARARDFDQFYAMLTNERRQKVLGAYLEHVFRPYLLERPVEEVAVSPVHRQPKQVKDRAAHDAIKLKKKKEREGMRGEEQVSSARRGSPRRGEVYDEKKSDGGRVHRDKAKNREMGDDDDHWES